MVEPKLNRERSCLMCGCKEYNVIASYDKPDRYELAVKLISTPDYYRKWVQCLECEFYYSIYSRDQLVLDKIYNSDYRDQESDWRGGASTKEIFEKVIQLSEKESENKNRIKWIKKEIEHLKNSDSIRIGDSNLQCLDIGGGTGVFSYEFQSSAWKTHIIDPAADGSFVQSEFGIPYIQEYYAPGKFDKKFDLITLIFALEHLADPKKIIRSLHGDMTENSLIYIEVPDSIAFSRLPLDDDIFNSCHLWLFGPNSLTALLDECNFEVFSLKRTRTMRGHYSLVALAGPKFYQIKNYV
jgi:hypothetical protein